MQFYWGMTLIKNYKNKTLIINCILFFKIKSSKHDRAFYLSVFMINN